MNTGQPKCRHQKQSTILQLRIEVDNEIDSRSLQYDVQLGAKFDYILHRANLIIPASEVKLIQNLCELERTQMLTKLTIALENTRLAGYIFTGNCSLFLDTVVNIAWLYHWPTVRFLLQVIVK